MFSSRIQVKAVFAAKGDGGGYRKINDRTRIRRGFPQRLTPLPVHTGARQSPPAALLRSPHGTVLSLRETRYSARPPPPGDGIPLGVGDMDDVREE